VFKFEVKTIDSFLDTEANVKRLTD